MVKNLLYTKLFEQSVNLLCKIVSGLLSHVTVKNVDLITCDKIKLILVTRV